MGTRVRILNSETTHSKSELEKTLMCFSNPELLPPVTVSKSVERIKKISWYLLGTVNTVSDKKCLGNTYLSQILILSWG